MGWQQGLGKVSFCRETASFYSCFPPGIIITKLAFAPIFPVFTLTFSFFFFFSLFSFPFLFFIERDITGVRSGCFIVWRAVIVSTPGWSCVFFPFLALPEIFNH